MVHLALVYLALALKESPKRHRSLRLPSSSEESLTIRAAKAETFGRAFKLALT